MTDTLHPPTAPHSPLAPPIEAPKSLKRSIGVVGGTLLTLSCLTPASSLFVIVPPLFADLGTGTALTIVIAAVLCIAVAFCYSELGTLIPSAGGEYAIHGTNRPNSVGTYASYGCIRMYNQDVVDLYARVDVGTQVYMTH